MTRAYLRTRDAASYLGVGKSTLERKRIEGTGPKFRRLGTRMISYAVADLDAWASENVHTSTSEKLVG
ncbi:MAG: helix-turn-helix domain-containing protein [Sphingomonadales bacterium]|nr:helix-turn-helix domain-containing protein [Sphingomonadales bacterium]MBK6490439.1 helix-turn-helix domain-containing protein [Sphingomonadales bacterium]MBK6719603.1 helix-turn-helix domain-containing protein [Sphingomonadales bacterium]MBK8860344.1 helix-turn-helix domain-containing protein [Sphingomonadales bacterium]MBK9589423.1 helix-turn-helix domain-containing protein [Sphingomonadales bacterium]